ncbi:MAG: hypothetical protein OEY51_10230 [Cyclobacteriaceae bacterium]|nr:hypothetical protein [Cyclobacteriaceae bacterium]
MKKNIIITTVMVVFALSIAPVSPAQEIDRERMEKDLTVLGNVLNSVVLRNNRTVLISGREPFKGSYVEGYGVVFAMSRPSYNRFSNEQDILGEMEAREEVQRAALMAQEAVQQAGLAVREAWERAQEKNGEIEEDSTQRGDLRKAERRDREVREMEIRRLQEEREKQREEWRHRNKEELIRGMKAFLVDYCDLIGQLRPEEKIKVVVNNSFGGHLFVGMSYSEEGSSSLSFEIQRKVISDYKKDKITREEAMDRVEVNEQAWTEPEDDLKVFSNILKTLYEPTLSRTFFMGRPPVVERIKDIGVIYHVKFYSSYPQGSLYAQRIHRMPTIGRKDVSQEERDEIVRDIYPDFIEEFLDNTLEYGRSIFSLKSDETLIIKAEMTECIDCGIPEMIELSVKAGVLQDYKKGKRTREESMKNIQLKEIGVQ